MMVTRPQKSVRISSWFSGKIPDHCKEAGISRKRFTAERIIGILREAEVNLSQGMSVGRICRAAGIAGQTYHRWRKEYGGMKAAQARRLKDLEKENMRLRKAVPDPTLDKQTLKEALEGYFQVPTDEALRGTRQEKAVSIRAACLSGDRSTPVDEEAYFHHQDGGNVSCLRASVRSWWDRSHNPPP